MLNLIISILGDAFDEFKLNVDAYNYSEMAEVILESELILVRFRRNEELKFMHACVNAYNQNTIKWKGKVLDVKNYLKDKFDKQDEVFEGQKKALSVRFLYKNIGDMHFVCCFKWILLHFL